MDVFDQGALAMAITRREFVGGTFALGAGVLLPQMALGQDDAIASPVTKSHEPFSFVHLTDMHVTPKRMGDKGYQACLESVRNLNPRPKFALMGGDLAFDGCYNEKDYFAEQIRLYREVSDSLGLPYYNCLGNHDVLGWSARRKVSTSDPDLGKRMIMDKLEWERPYYSFDYNGWHFAVLDCIYPIQADHGPTYEPRIGDEQLEWLAYDLGSAGDRPKVCLTHIAAFCNVGQLTGDPNRKAMDGHMVLWDSPKLRAILERHSVKALLQGHSHHIEEYFYNGVWYVTANAVSGAWWSGSWGGKTPGYCVYHCKGDQLTWEHHLFEWEAQLEPEDKIEREKIAEQQAFYAERKALLKKERRGQR
jgi:Icc protein